MIIYGASGHSKVIIDIIRSGRHGTIDYIIDDNLEIRSLLGLPVLHKLPEDENQEIVYAIGNNRIRKKLSEKYPVKPVKALIHNSAIISEYAEIMDGSVVMAKAVVNASAEVGEHCILNTSCIIEHDVMIGNFAHISPGTVITGGVRIGEGTQIGAGAAVIPGIKIGKWATIGAGAVVINDIPDNAVVVGNPGKIIKYNTHQNG